MANRQLVRTILLQTLYEWDMRGLHKEHLQSYAKYIIESFNTGTDTDSDAVISFIEELAKKQVVIDEIIEKAAPDWPIAKIAITDRNVLRIGLYELLFGDHATVPPKVAINEAVELAKKFGGPKSNKFVNGILGAVYREIGEPGKDQVTKKKMPEVPYEDMPVDEKGAAVIYSIDEQNIVRIGMVHDIFGYWTLAKGSIEKGETTEEGTIREVKEETDWSIKIVDTLGDNEYIAYHPERGPVRKHVSYYLGQSAHTKPTLEVGSGGLDDVRWFELDVITDLNMYEDVSQMLIKAIGIIVGNNDDELENSDEKIEESQEDETETKEESQELQDFSKMKVTELKELAKERDVKVTGMKKAEIIEALKQS